MKKKGFTLVELMAVIILLGVIALIAYPVVTNTINNSKQKAFEETIRQIEQAANRYGNDNSYDLPQDESTVTNVSLDQLIRLGYIKKTNNGKLLNPIDNSEMRGCVLIQYDPYYTQYMYEYSETCSGQIVYAPPTVTFEVLDKTPVNGWYNEGFYVKATITDNSGNGIKESYTCVGDNECNPTTTLSELEKTFYVVNQGNNRMCIKTIDNNDKETTLCSDIYRLDKAAPTIESNRELVVASLGENINIKTYFNNPIYSISSGLLSCTNDNISELSVGTHEVTCTATGNNGLSISDKVTIMVLEQKVNYTMLYDEGDECTDITGGWERYGYNSGTFIKNSNSIYASGVGNNKNTNAFGTNLGINVTDYSQIFFNLSVEYDEKASNGLYYTEWHLFLGNGKYDGNYDILSPYIVKYTMYDGVPDEENKNSLYKHLESWMGAPKLVYNDISKLEGNLYPTFAYANWGANNTFPITLYNVFMTKTDDIETLANLADIEYTTVADILSQSNVLLNNENAVKYMILNCTGDFMISAIKSDTFMSSLNSSPYKNLVYANEHWSKFIQMIP